MRIIDEKTRRFAVNSIFPTFFCAAFGLVLAQVGASQMEGSWSFHVFLGIPGIVLSGLALFRARLHWSAGRGGLAPLHAGALGGLLVLAAAGALFGMLVSAGSVLLAGMAAASACLLPWTKIPVCRTQFVVSSLSILAGAAAWIVMDDNPAQSLYFLTAAWMLYVPGMFLYLLVLVSLDHAYRICNPGLSGTTGSDVRMPLPQ